MATRRARTVEQIQAEWRAAQEAVRRQEKAHVERTAWRSPTKADLPAARAAMARLSAQQRGSIVAVHIARNNGWVRFRFNALPEIIIDPARARESAAMTRIRMPGARHASVASGYAERR